MSKKLSMLLLLLPVVPAGAQSIRLTPYRAPSALYVDMDRLYNYNRYEHSRFEVGLTWVTPNEAAGKSRMFLGQWTLRGYAAYGTFDRRLKYGGGAQLRLPGRLGTKLRIMAFDDLEAAASHKMEPYRMLSPESNPAFLASRFVGMKGLQVEASVAPRHDWTLTASVLISREQYRFDKDGPLYQRFTPDAMPEVRSHASLSARADWGRKLSLLATAGLMKDVYVDAGEVPYLRLLAQYDAEPGDLGLRVFGQAGYATAQAPYSRLFDMSGTARSVYFFRNTFLTVRPNTFTASMFAHLCLNYTAPMPLWETSWSRPQPFLQLNAMWGWLHGQDETGFVLQEGLPLQSPYLGLFEPSTGFDGLLRWGLLDLGFGVAYQICPPAAPYMNDDPTENFALGIVATLIFDKYASASAKHNLQNTGSENNIDIDLN